jgi:hypothetical protein
MKRTIGIALAAVALIGAPAAARAEDKTQPQSDGAKAAAAAQATKLLADADRLFDAHDYERARIFYATAYGLMPSTDILWSLAVSEFESGHVADALRRMRQYIRSPKARASRVTEARSRYIPEGEKQTGRVEVTAPAGAKILVDTQLVIGDAPLEDPIDITPGAHTIEARLPDRVLKIEVQSRAGGAVRANFLDASSGVTTEALGPQPVLASTSPAPASPPAADQPPPPEKFWNGRRVVGAVVAGVGVGAVVGGIAFGLASQSSADDAERMRGQLTPGGGCADPGRAGCAELKDAVSSQDRNAVLSYVFYGVGAVAIVTGVALVLWPTKPARTGWITPSVGPGGFALHGRF